MSTQKQIEAADTEHGRLAALKAEREVAEAAAAALASANAVSQTENATRSQLESQRAHEAGGQLETPNHPAPNPNDLSNLTSGDQAANQNVLDTQPAAPDPQRQIAQQGIRKRWLQWKRKCILWLRRCVNTRLRILSCLHTYGNLLRRSKHHGRHQAFRLKRLHLRRLWGILKPHKAIPHLVPEAYVQGALTRRRENVCRT